MTGSQGGGEGAARRAAEQRLNRLLALIVEAAADAVGFDGGSVTVRSGDDAATVAATSPDLVALDAAQYAAGDGPCLDALGEDQAMAWTAGDDDARWRAFQEAASELGIATSLSLPLPIDETTEIAASLNLYAYQREQVTAEQLELATQFAFQLALALQTIGATTSTAEMARRAADAMRSHAAIEQAKGFLMAQRGLTAPAASALLEEMAQAQGITTRQVAARIIEQGEAGDPPP